MELKLNLNGKKDKVLDMNALYDLIIIGSGPAGLNAALYAKRKGLTVGIIGKKSGCQVLDTTSVENYLGFEFKTGEDLVKEFTQHVSSLEVPVLKDVEVSSISQNEEIGRASCRERV